MLLNLGGSLRVTKNCDTLLLAKLTMPLSEQRLPIPLLVRLASME